MQFFRQTRFDDPIKMKLAAEATKANKTTATKTSAATNTNNNNNKKTTKAETTASSTKRKRKREIEADPLFGAGSDDDEAADEDAEDEDDDDDGIDFFSNSSSKPKSKSSASASGQVAARVHGAKPARRHEEEDEEDGDEEDDDEPNGDSSSKHARKKPRTAPEELSSKRRVNGGLIVTSLPSSKSDLKRQRDPRFDAMCGEFDARHFSSHYAWLNDERQKELNEWQTELKRGTRNGRPLTPDERMKLTSQIDRTKQQLASQKRQDGETSLMTEWKRNERKAQKEGKKPFFLKKSEQKKLALASRYLQLKSQKGALQKFMVKKTKDIKNKDHTYMPREQE